VWTTVIGVSGVRGADYPAHFLRALVWERAGLSSWNNLWYAGHTTPTYSLLAPPAMAAVGPFAVVAVGSLLATYCFSRLMIDAFPGRTTSLANHAFAMAMLVNVVVGRAPFALGLALAMVAALAWHRRSMAIAVAAAFLVPLTSPVAAVFLIIAAAAVVAGGVPGVRAPTVRADSLRAVAITIAAGLPLAVNAALFGEPGWFPFRGDHFLMSLIVLSLVVFAARRRVVRIAAALSIAAAVVTFLVPNPLGGNYVRLAQIVAVPVAVAALPSVRRGLVAPFVLALAIGFGWSLQPGVVAGVEWWGDDSIEAAYHRPLINQVRARNLDGRPVGRLEIPFTENHWESYFVAAEVPFARGWERQLDLAHNAPLYDDRLTLDGYHDWLRDNGVRWIAIPDVQLDHAGVIEERLVDDAVRERIRWLKPAWANDDWRLYEVSDYEPIVERPAELVEQSADSIVVHTDRPATVTIRFRHTDYLTIDGSACLAPDGDGWIEARLPEAGEYRITVDPGVAWLTDAEFGCE
jgi:hypothetical protein